MPCVIHVKRLFLQLSCCALCVCVFHPDYRQSDVSVYSCGSGSYREDPAGPTAGLAEPVPCDDMPAVSGAAGGRGLVKGRGAGG